MNEESINNNNANNIENEVVVPQEVPEIRSEEVEQAKADLESGNLGTEKDYDQAVTALLLEL